MRTIKQHTKKQLDRLLNGDAETPRMTIFIRKPDGSRILYGCWPPHPTLKPGDEVLTVTADSEATAETFKKIRGLTT